MFDRLGRLVLSLRFVLVLGWLVAAAVLGVLGPSLAKAGSADETSFLPRDSESLGARRVIAGSFPSDSAPTVALIVFSRTSGLTDADRAAIEGLRTYFEGSGHPAGVLRYVTAEHTTSLSSMFRSTDGVVELARLDMSTPAFLPETNATIIDVRAHLAEPGVLPAGLTAQLTGQAAIGRDYLRAIQDGTDRTTMATILLVVIVLLLIYRAPLAALVPLITIGSAFLVSRGILGFMAEAGWQLSSVLDSFIVVLAFGVGTDYTIFLISRFREELGRYPHDEAVRVSVSRIGAVISASAATVVVGLTSMAAARFGMIQTTGPALAIVIVVTLAAGLTLTPSLLAIFGRRLFWPLHEKTRAVTDERRGFWAALARRITARPGLLAGVVLAVLIAPALWLPALKQNFDVLNELPAGAESREGFETLSQHLAQGELMPVTVLIKMPGDSSTILTSERGLAAIEALEKSIAALPAVQSVRSVVDPMGEGRVSDMLSPSVQLSTAAAAFSQPPGTDINVQLSDASLAGIVSTRAYVSGLRDAFPGRSTGDIAAAEADLDALAKGIAAAQQLALVSNQLDEMAAKLQGAMGSSSSTDTAAQLAALQSYFEGLAAADPAVKSVPSYQSAVAALAALATNPGLGPYMQLVSSIQGLSAWFKAQPTKFYYVPPSATASDGMTAIQEALAAARGRLPGELKALAAGFGPDDKYVAPDLRAAYISGDGTVTRLYVTTSTNPYDTKTFQTIRDLRALLATDPGHFGALVEPATAGVPTAYVGGSTAEFADVQDTISADFVRVATITVIGILIVLILLLRAVVAPVYLVLTVLLSYATSLSLSALILQGLFGQAGINYFIPLIVFVLLVALGSDYNIFLMSRVREESSTRELRPGIRIASARTGTVITSAGLILAGTFGALVTSPLQLLFQAGLAVALGVLIDTFVVRSLLVPAITAFVGERAWWPFHRRAG
jgi:RND superfamily putative drug exporter